MPLKHFDMGSNGSKFVYKHPPLKNRTLFGLLLCILLAIFFSLGLHLLDKKILSTLCIVLMGSLLMKLHAKVDSEVVLILPSLGVQITTKTFAIGQESTHFIHLSSIKDVIINEAITMQSVIYYLVVLIKDKGSQEVKQLYPLFTHSSPRLDQLMQVFAVTQEKLELHEPRS